MLEIHVNIIGVAVKFLLDFLHLYYSRKLEILLLIDISVLSRLNSDVLLIRQSIL